MLIISTKQQAFGRLDDDILIVLKRLLRKAIDSIDLLFEDLIESGKDLLTVWVLMELNLGSVLVQKVLECFQELRLLNQDDSVVLNVWIASNDLYGLQAL